MSDRVVVFEETGEERAVTGYCKTCLGPRNLRPLPSQGVVSPRGLVHYGQDYGLTLCGKDATGAGWWWPL